MQSHVEQRRDVHILYRAVHVKLTLYVPLLNELKLTQNSSCTRARCSLTNARNTNLNYNDIRLLDRRRFYEWCADLEGNGKTCVFAHGAHVEFLAQSTHECKLRGYELMLFIAFKTANHESWSRRVVSQIENGAKCHCSSTSRN